MFEKQELEAEKRRLQKEREALETEKAAFREMLKQAPEERPIEYLTFEELQDQINRITLRNERIKYDMWVSAIFLDQQRKFGKEYTT